MSMGLKLASDFVHHQDEIRALGSSGEFGFSWFKPVGLLLCSHERALLAQEPGLHGRRRAAAAAAAAARPSSERAVTTVLIGFQCGGRKERYPGYSAIS